MHFRDPFRKAPLLISLMSVFFSELKAQEVSPHPNVILIMADDLGYGDLSCYGSKKNRTPVLDQLAADGIRLTNFYSGATVCTPSRMALLTGCYPSRVGWQGGVMGHKMSPQTGLNPAVPTMAEIFKAANCRTAMSGKWHLGEAKGFLPNDRGFEDAFFIRSSNNQTKTLYHNAAVVADRFDNRLFTEHFTHEAIRYIREPNDKPFFLYLPYTAPHFPAEAHPDWKGKSNNGEYGDVVEELDSRIGEILTALKETNQEKNTIVVFLSDNGPEGSQRNFNSAEPHRGGKWTSLEGGTRVPCIIAWPGVIAAAQVREELVAAIDLLPTLANACRVPIVAAPDAPPLDGLNLWPSLLKQVPQHPRQDLLFWEGWATPQAIRVGSWKLYFDEVKDIDGTEKGLALFDIATDLKEEHNLAATHPARVTEMQQQARAQLKNIREKSLPLGGKLETAPPNQIKSPRWLE